MKPSERDELLVRLDERTINIYRLNEKQERHLSELNDRVAKNTINISNNNQKLDQGLGLKISKGQKIGGSTGIITLLALAITALGKSLGWW